MVFSPDDVLCLLNNGIYVDLGHKEITFYAVEDHGVVDKVKLGYGGHHVSVLLTKLLALHETSNFYRLPASSGTIVKERHCKISLNLKESLQV